MHGYSLLRTQINNDYFHELFDRSVEFDVPIESHRTFTMQSLSISLHMTLTVNFLVGLDTETGPGVLETALAYTSALRMADNAILFKYMAKSIGMKYGVIPSFMAKPWGSVRRLRFRSSHLGSFAMLMMSLVISHASISYQVAVGKSEQTHRSLQAPRKSMLTLDMNRHVHVSLRDKDGKNIFAVSEADIAAGGRKGAANDDTKFISQEAEWFLAGILDGIADILPMVRRRPFTFPLHPNNQPTT